MVVVPVEDHPDLLLVLGVRIRLVLDLVEVPMVEDHLALARILVRILEEIQVIVYMDT